MNDSFFVRCGEALCDLYCVLDGFALRKCAAIEYRTKRFALEQFRTRKASRYAGRRRIRREYLDG